MNFHNNNEWYVFYFYIGLSKETENFWFNRETFNAAYEDMFRYNSHIIINSNPQLNKHRK